MLTELEQKVLRQIANDCYGDASSDIGMIAEGTGITKPSAKGVVGSLVKKGYVMTEIDEINFVKVNFINIIVDDTVMSFACDQMELDEYEQKIRNNMPELAI